MMRLPFGQLIDDLLLFLPVGGKPENICSLRWLRADASPTKGPGHIARPSSSWRLCGQCTRCGRTGTPRDRDYRQQDKYDDACERELVLG